VATETGPVVRRSRTDTAAESRTRILDAAVACLVEQGFAQTSTVTIQNRAGISRGGLLHHFGSREELLAAAANHLATLRVEQERVTGVHKMRGTETDAERLDVAIEVLWATFQQPHFVAATELWIAARTTPGLPALILEQERTLGKAITGVTDQIFGESLCCRSAYPELRDVLLTSMRGVALTYFFNPRDYTREPYLARWRTVGRAVLRVAETAS
jgi:AcrR family transcriptional regulator